MELGQRYDALQTAACAHQASLKTGRGWLRLFARLFPGPGQRRIERLFSTGGTPPHGCILFGACLGAGGGGEEEATALFLHQLLRDQLGAAVRLGIVGPLEAVERHAALRPECAKAAGASRLIPCDGAFRGAPQLDLGAGRARTPVLAAVSELIRCPLDHHAHPQLRYHRGPGTPVLTLPP